jgi:hypothetical protein
MTKRINLSKNSNDGHLKVFGETSQFSVKASIIESINTSYWWWLPA